MAPASSAAAAAVAASSLEHLLRPLHWGAVLRHPRVAEASPILFRLRTLIIASITTSFVFSELLVLYHQGTEDLDLFILILGIADTIAMWVFRMAHITLHESDFHKLALQVSQDFADFVTWEDVPVMRRRCRTVRRISLTYMCFGLSNCAYFLSLPSSPDGLPYVLALPFDATKPASHTVAWLYCMIVTVHTVIMTIAINSFNISVITQLCIQLTQLNKKIVSLNKDMPEEPGQSGKKPARRDLYCRLKQCILHHQAIIKNVDLLQSCLGVLLLGQSLSVGTAACFEMFQIATSADGLQQIGKFGTHLFTILAELFIYCWFGDELITESENVALAAYDAATSLQDSPVSIKRSLVLLMQRAQRPLCITAGGFFPLSRESFVAVLNVSYSFVAILRNFKNED
ncbi:odorant receptor Or2-like [Schistocerca gregaria]|uniref:odorant receptor Or2-like n=1 Tax=Schistocerca gregaria TaxID=7010 RepID=UPI00211F2229|nr:odorant receptor Or2-like [Schistocerca gregaria]